jgi:branched-chain amino acid transport system substrate-binding protein
MVVLAVAGAVGVTTFSSPGTPTPHPTPQCVTPRVQAPLSTAQSSTGSSSAPATSATIYTSLTGDANEPQQAQDILLAEQLAVQQAGGNAGDVAVSLVPLGNQTGSVGQSDPSQTAANARRAAVDPAARAYIGEFDSDASKISIPILNQAGVIEISPSNTYLGLTRNAAPGEPAKYYPTGTRSYARVIPNDAVEAAAAVSYMRDCHVRSVYVVSDEASGEQGLASAVATDARETGIRVVGTSPFAGTDPRSLASQVVASRPSATFFSGSSVTDALTMWHDVHAVAPSVKLFASHGVAAPGFAAAMGSAQQVTYLTAPVLAARCYPPAGQAFFANFARMHGHEPSQYAIFGFVAMQRILEALANSTADKFAVRQAFFHSGEQPSAIGTFGIDPNGDTTLSSYGGYRVLHHTLVFDRVLHTESTPSTTC